MIKTLVKFVNNQFRRSVKFESCNQKHFSTLIDGNVKIFHARNGCVGEKEIEETMKKDFVLLEFITIEEESNLMLEIEKSFRRTKYEYDHWDNVSFLSFYSIFTIHLQNISNEFHIKYPFTQIIFNFTFHL